MIPRNPGGGKRTARSLYSASVTIDTPTELEAALAERYEIRQVLGKGGMATVFLAYDRKHQREVAVKALRPDLTATLGADRFLKEIQIVARLTHPHILAMHESGEAAGFLYYVMPYITGGSLRNRLEAAGWFRPADAVAIAAPVADALSYAHRMGIFHRDIKPENILFSEGHPVVADFGIARAVSTAGVGNLTRTGFPLGTPGYMSPEQAAGMTDLDGRSDVYSLAVVVYEMLVGETPGRWPTEDAVRAGRFLEASAGHRARLTEAGAAIEGALVRGLAIRHDQRTATPAILLTELQGQSAPPPRRKYDEEQIREIVRRASELEASNPTSGAMTIGGIEALAAEVGISPESVKKAVRAVNTPVPSPVPAESPGWTRVFGAPGNLVIEREIEGEVPDSEFPVMVDEIRRILQQLGQVSQLGRSFSWNMTQSMGRRRDVEVAVSVRGGKTRIMVRENLLQLKGVFGGICGVLGGPGGAALVGISIGALGLHPLALLAIIPTWWASVFGIARTVYARSFRTREQEFTYLVGRLADMATELAVAQPAINPPAARKFLG